MATTTSMSAKEFSALAKQATKQVKGIFSSPFVIINALNKAAKGDYSKLTNCTELKHDRIKAVAAQVKMLHTGRYPFEYDILPKSEYNKRLGFFTPVPERQSEYTAILCGEVVYHNGRELYINGGQVGFWRAIPLTETGVFGAFSTIVRKQKQGVERAAKQAEREAKQAAKQAEKVAKAKKIVTAVFGELVNTFSDDEILSKAAIIKAAK